MAKRKRRIRKFRITVEIEELDENENTPEATTHQEPPPMQTREYPNGWFGTDVVSEDGRYVSFGGRQRRRARR